MQILILRTCSPESAASRFLSVHSNAPAAPPHPPQTQCFRCRKCWWKKIDIFPQSIYEALVPQPEKVNEDLSMAVYVLLLAPMLHSARFYFARVLPTVESVKCALGGTAY